MDLSILDEDGDIIPASAREPLFNNSVEINTLPWLFDDNLPLPEVTQGLVSPSLSPTLVAAASTRAETVVDTNFSLSLLPVPKDGLVSLDGLAALDIRDGHPASDDEEEALPLKAPPQTAAKRAGQRSLFKDWVKTEIEVLTKVPIKGEKDVDEDILSIRSLLAKQDSVAISDPREYQIELYERAKKENTIAVLDTGSGKTLIAVLLLRHILDQEVENRAAGKSPRIAFFVVTATTLVFQQFSVLESNLDHKIDRFCGSMGLSLWTKGVWEKHFKSNMVIVCTADVLHQCLFHSFIKMEQINLLIFDEAHHAKQSHPFAKIIREFYMEVQDKTKRPRVFGMTASPADAKDDVVQAARQLELLLDCRITTVPLSDEFKNRATEYVQYYPKLPVPFETTLHQELKGRFGNLGALKRLFSASKGLSSVIGRWGSDVYWSFALADEQARKAESRVEKEHFQANEDVSELDSDMKLLKEAAEYVSDCTFGSPQINDNDLSPKVLKLHSLLQQHFERPTDSRCIVFVEQRSTARLLLYVFNKIGGPNLHAGLLTGAGVGNQGDQSVSFRTQVVTLLAFRKGTINCLFATSVAEEGLDIPDCNLVIRFDLYKSMIGYVQSKGRARHKHSRFIDMIETDNRTQAQVIIEARRATATMLKWCRALPEDRILRGNDYDLETHHDVQERTVFMDPKTKARITYDSSLSVIGHFCAVLPQYDNMVAQTPQYVMSSEGGRYVCEVILPTNSPIERFVGLPSSRKATAKRSAAFGMCKLLRAGKYLDEHLLPIYTKSLPAMRNAQLALNSKKKGKYPMMLKPTLWERDRGTIPTQVYLTVINIEGSLDRPHQPLGILTRHPLPDFATFPMFLEKGNVPIVVIESLKEAMPIEADMIEKATDYNLLLLRDVFNKTYERAPAMMSYWIVPVHSDILAPETPFKRIDWETLNLCATQDEYEWDPERSHEDYEDKFLVDRWTGARRWFTKGVDPTKKPLDPVPEEAVKHKFMENILEYSITLFKTSRSGVAWKWKTDQVVIEADQMQFRRNILAKPEKKEKKLRYKAWLIPQPLKLSTISSKIATMTLVFPAIIHRIEDYMIALEACDVVGLKLSANLALEAMTKDSDNSEEHQEQRVNYRPGMGANYERLEFMGDCFLKMATSISLFGKFPNNDEYEFHVQRMCMICNKNLFNSARDMEIYQYVRSMSFSRRTWYPQGIVLIKGKGAGNIDAFEKYYHSLGDKTVADVCEALIGAAFVQYNRLDGWKPEDWDAAVKATTVMVKNEEHEMLKWDDYIKAYDIPEYQTAPVTAVQRDLAEKVELEHPYHFKWPRLLRSAFNHPSNPSSWDKVPSYQRLEFLGDSLLDTACVSHLFYRYPDKDPQWLTEHKMAMVSNKFLGALCVKIGFHRHMRHCHSQLDGQIREYVIEATEAEKDTNGACDYWTSVKAPPKCLPDIVEAYVGAIFVDSGFNYGVVQTFFDMHIKPFFEDMTIYDTFANNHPTTFLHNLLAIQLGCRDYRLLAEEVPQGDPGAPCKVVAGFVLHDRVVCHATSQSGRYAKVKASVKALELLQGLAPFEFRQRYGCDCRDQPEDEKSDDEGKFERQSGEDGVENMGTAV